MTNIDRLISELMSECFTGDEERDHIRAGELLLKYIGSKEVEKIFNSIEKWYA